MPWKQTKDFDVKKMGTKPGYCLQNVRLGFGIAPKYASAKDDMEAQKAAGTLHALDTLPKDVAVPIFIDTPSEFEHVIVSDHGTFYSDGVQLTSLKGLKAFGWGETLCGVRVVELIPETVPEGEAAKKTNEEIADEVMAGKWGKDPERAEKLKAAGYDRDAIQAIVDARMKGDAQKEPVATSELHKGDVVVPTKLVDHDGTRLVQYHAEYTLLEEPYDGKVAIGVGDDTWALMDVANLRKVR